MVSVVIPIYNVAAFLSQCVDSVSNQTMSDVQIILVDDGSTDISSSICDEYAAKDSRITVIHKANGGLSDARNVGTLAATGEYLFYLDSDDYLEPTAIAELLHCLKQTGADLVVSGFSYKYDDREEIAPCKWPDSECYDRIEAMGLLMQGDIQTFAWGKLMKTELAKAHMFPKGKRFEDHFWTHVVFNDCERVAVLNRPLVHYRQRADSISFTYDLARLDIVQGWQARIDYLRERYPQLVEMYLERCARDTLAVAWLVLTRMKKQKAAGFAVIRQFVVENQLTLYSEGNARRLLHAISNGNVWYSIMAIWMKATRRLQR